MIRQRLAQSSSVWLFYLIHDSGGLSQSQRIIDVTSAKSIVACKKAKIVMIKKKVRGKPALI
jgi:hypothetical protein